MQNSSVAVVLLVACWAVYGADAAHAGVQVSTPSSAAPDTIRLQPADGVLQGHEGFTRVTAVRELSDGRVFVADPGEKRLNMVDWDGSRVTVIGRQGAGPGEYESPSRLYALGGDTTLLTDDVTRRWFVLVGTDFVRTFASNRPAAQALGPNLSGADRYGNALGVAGYSYTDGSMAGSRMGADSLRVHLVRGAAREDEPRLEAVANVGGRGRYGIKVSRTPPYVSIAPSPVGTEEQALLYPDAWIALALTDPYRVAWRRPDGRWIRGAPLDHEPIEDAAVMCRIVLRHELGTCDEERIPPFPRHLPPFLPDALLATPEGDLLIRRMPAETSMDVHYDVIGRDGGLKSVVILPPDQRIVGFGPGSVYVITEDEFELQWLSRHPW